MCAAQSHVFSIKTSFSFLFDEFIESRRSNKSSNMSIVNILKRASTYILGSDEYDNKNDLLYEDNETLFCKNNVCVHPPAIVRQESDILHYPGYLTVNTKTFTDQYNNAKRPTLVLTWIPNSTLRKSVENGWHKTHTDELKTLKNSASTITTISENTSMNTEKSSVIHYVFQNSTNPFIEPYNEQMNQLSDSKSVNFSDYSETISLGSNSDKASTSNDLSRGDDIVSTHDMEEIDEGIDQTITTVQTPDEIELKNELQPLLAEKEDGIKMVSQHAVTSVNITIASQNVEIYPPPQERNIHHHHNPQAMQTDKFSRSLSLNSNDENPNWMSPELFAYKHNLAFPDSATASPIQINKKIPLKCRRFSVDLSQMRALRLFFNDESCTSGQLVIASRESQYKILHFHHGGLDHLAQVLHQWHCLLHNIKLAPGTDEPNLPYRQFMVCRPEVKKEDMHPEEDNVSKITTDYFYGTLLNDKGQIEDDLQLRKCVFFGGLEKGLRKTVWPFLLHCYSTSSTFDERLTLGNIRKNVSN